VYRQVYCKSGAALADGAHSLFVLTGQSIQRGAQLQSAAHLPSATAATEILK